MNPTLNWEAPEAAKKKIRSTLDCLNRAMSDSSFRDRANDWDPTVTVSLALDPGSRGRDPDGVDAFFFFSFLYLD